MCEKCANCGKDFNDGELIVVELCQDCLFHANFTNPDGLRTKIADELEDMAELCLDEETRRKEDILDSIAQRLKKYAMIIERL